MTKHINPALPCAVVGCEAPRDITRTGRVYSKCHEHRIEAMTQWQRDLRAVAVREERPVTPQEEQRARSRPRDSRPEQERDGTFQTLYVLAMNADTYSKMVDSGVLDRVSVTAELPSGVVFDVITRRSTDAKGQRPKQEQD